MLFSLRAKSDAVNIEQNGFCVCRRQPPLNPYKLKCDKEPLNSR